MKAVDNWKKLHKSSTVVLSIIGTLVSLMEIVLPQMGLLQPVLDPVTYGVVMFILTIMIGIGRYVQQDCVRIKQDDSTKS